MDGKRQWRLPHRGCPQGGIVASTEMLRRRCHNRVMERLRPRLAVPARPALAVPSRLAAPARVAAGLAGLAAAAGALAVAEGPGRSTTYAGSSAAGAALTLSAGLALIAAGLVICLGPRPRPTGDLALLAGFTWFAPVDQSGLHSSGPGRTPLSRRPVRASDSDDRLGQRRGSSHL
jgi:hypothetical protein